MTRDKIRKFLPYLLCWFLSLTIGLYFRLYPLWLHSPSDTYEKATVFVLSKIKAQVANRINSSFPRLSDLERSRLTKEGFDNILHNESNTTRQNINKIAREMEKESTSKKSFPYLLASDSFYYFGLTENILETGKMADTVKGSKYFNKLMLAPLGFWEPLNLHPYVGYFTYRFLKFFRTDIPLMYAVSFTPLMVVSVILMIFLVLCRTMGCGILNSFVASAFFLLSPVFVKRSAFSWYDDDPYNILFLLLITTVFFFGLNKRNQPRQGTLWALSCVALFALYSLFWHGWVYLFSVIFLSCLTIAIYNHLVVKNFHDTKNIVIFSIIILLGCFVGICGVFGAPDFFILFKEGLSALHNFLNPSLALWPDVYISVGELQKSSLKDFIELDGCIPFLILSSLGFAVYGYRSFLSKEGSSDSFKFIFLFFFFASSLFLACGAKRFTLLFLIPLSLSFAVGLKYASLLIMGLIPRLDLAYRHKESIIRYGSFVIIPILLIMPMKQAHQSMILIRPIFNETWDKALTVIKHDTPKDSIINSWWPPGHFIKSVARRHVTFDGATINNPQAYWMANVFLSQTEADAAGLLRMLNNSANQAAEYLQRLGIKLSVAAKKLNEVTHLNRRQARAALKEILSEEQINHLLNLTHRRPPPSYLFIYSDLVDKNLELGFFANWDFEKVEKLNDREIQGQIPSRNSKNYVQFLWDISGGPLRYSQTLSQLSTKKNKVYFERGISIDLENMACLIASREFGTGIPYSIVYQRGDDVIEKKLTDANLGYSVLLFKESGLYNCILLDRRLAKSLLMRLYFFDGKGLRYFKPFIKETDLTGRTRVFAYKIDWEQFETDLASQ